MHGLISEDVRNRALRAASYYDAASVLENVCINATDENQVPEIGPLPGGSPIKESVRLGLKIFQENLRLIHESLLNPEERSKITRQINELGKEKTENDYSKLTPNDMELSERIGYNYNLGLNVWNAGFSTVLHIKKIYLRRLKRRFNCRWGTLWCGICCVIMRAPFVYLRKNWGMICVVKIIQNMVPAIC